MDKENLLLTEIQELDNQPEKEQEPQLEPSQELAENMEFFAENCRATMSQIQNTLLQLEILLNGNLRKVLLAHDKNDALMQNLENLLASGRNQHKSEEKEPKKRLIKDIAIIRSGVSGKVKTFLVNKFSEYKGAVDTLMENLNGLLQDFKEAHEALREAHAKLKTEVAKVNLNRHRQTEKDHEQGVIRLKQSAEIPHPKLPRDIKLLPDSIDPTLITPEILEKNLHKHYGYPISSDQPPRQHQLPESPSP